PAALSFAEKPPRHQRITLPFPRERRCRVRSCGESWLRGEDADDGPVLGRPHWAGGRSLRPCLVVCHAQTGPYKRADRLECEGILCEDGTEAGTGDGHGVIVFEIINAQRANARRRRG